MPRSYFGDDIVPIHRIKELKERIIQNSLYCKLCDTEIISTHRHHFISCKCGSFSADGGKDYLKRCGNITSDNYEDTSVVQYYWVVRDPRYDYENKETTKIYNGELVPVDTPLVDCVIEYDESIIEKYR